MVAGGWRLLGDALSPPADGATNMALDAALLESVVAGAGPVVRFYRWDRPTLSFGRNQPAAGRYDRAAARERGIAFVRRPTGGQAVLHADELTYAVVAPVAVIGRPRTAYRRINEALVTGLRRLGVAAEMAELAELAEAAEVAEGTEGAATAAGAAGPGADWAAACFREPAAGEVVVGGRKLIGSAQRCEGRVILQHGSLLLAGSQAPAEELLLRPPAPPAGARPEGGGWTTLEDVLGRRPALAELVDALVAGWLETVGTALAPARPSVEETMRARALRAEFASPEWTWRR